MDLFKWLVNLLSISSINDLRIHLSNIKNLYTSPVKTWRRIISFRNKASNFFILFIIYYTVLIFIVINDYALVFPIVIGELLLTLIPFSIFYIPFLLFTKIWNKRIKSDRLFKLLFILKIQFSIFLLLCFHLIKWTKMESPFILVNNFIVIVWVAFICILPFIVKISIYKKLLWTFTNYIFSLLFFVLTYYLSNFIPDFNLLEKATTVNTPANEYTDFKSLYEYSDLHLSNEYFIGILNYSNTKKSYLRNTQFATTDLVLKIMDIDLKNKIEKLKVLKTLTALDSLNRISKIKKVIPTFNLNKELIKINYLDSCRLAFNKKFFNDLSLTDSIMKKAKFVSNKNFFRMLNMQLVHFEKIYTSLDSINKILQTEPKYVIKADSNNFVLIFKLKNKNLTKRKDRIDATRESLEKREQISEFLPNLLIFPLNYVFDKFNL